MQGVDRWGFSTQETEQAIENSLRENLSPKQSGISSQRIRMLVKEALKSIPVDSKPSILEQCVISIQSTYEATSDDKLLFQIYFIALNVLLLKQGSKPVFEYYPLLFGFIFAGSLALFCLTETIVERAKEPMLNVFKEIKLKINGSSQPPLSRELFLFIEIVGKLVYLVANTGVKIIFHASIMISGLFIGKYHVSLSFSLLFSGASGICYSLSNFYYSICKGVASGIIAPIDPDLLLIDPLEDLEVCTIRQEKIKLPGYLTQCKHVFELYAIIKWLMIEKSCPICRSEVFEADPRDQLNQLVFLSRNQIPLDNTL